jgi:hypothetical protein
MPIGLPLAGEQVVGIRQAGLNLEDDRAEKAGREKSRPKRTRRILADCRQRSKRRSGRRRHPAKLPHNLLADGLGPIEPRQSCGFGGIRGGTESVCAHMSDGCGLSRRSSGRQRVSAHLTSGASNSEAPTDPLGDAEFATSKRPCSGDRMTRASVLWSFRLEQSQHALRTIRRPCRDDPPVRLAQRLRRTHADILARVSAATPCPTLILFASYATAGTAAARVISVAPVASSQSRVGVRAIRITTESQPGQRMIMPIPWAYTSNAPTDLAVPQLAHVARAVVKS